MPEIPATINLTGENVPLQLQHHAIRSYYYRSVRGGAKNEIAAVREALWEQGFHAEVFGRVRNREKAKGVDIALTKDLLCNAHFNNYDVACLIAGDGDYVPLVEEVKRLGKAVYVAFFRGEGLGLSPEPRLASDMFLQLDDFFIRQWTTHTQASGASGS